MTTVNKTYKAVRWTSLSTLIRAGLQLAQVAVLARYLIPQEFGLMAIVSVVISYVGLISDMGLSAAFIQRQVVSNEERSSLYWLAVIIGFFLTFLTIIISPLVSVFFNEPDLTPLLIIISTNFVVVALGQQLRINAEKDLNFQPIVFIEVTASIIGFMIAVTIATQGGGVYALVISAVVVAWMTTIFSWGFLAKGWRPLYCLRWEHVKWYVNFGGATVINNVINHVNSTVDIFFGGHLLGASSLGLYSLPRNLIFQVQQIINPIFTRIGFPLIASVQDDKERIHDIYLKTMNMTASLNAPIYVFSFVFSPEIIFLLLGSKWNDAVPLLRILSLWGLLRSFGNPVGSLLFGLGRIRLSLCWNAGVMVVTPLVVWYGSLYGVNGMAWSMVFLMAVLFIPSWYFLIEPNCGAGFYEYSRQVIVPTFCALLAGAIAAFVTDNFNSQIVRFIVGGLSGAFVYMLLSWLVNRQFFLALIKLTSNRS